MLIYNEATGLLIEEGRMRVIAHLGNEASHEEGAFVAKAFNEAAGFERAQSQMDEKALFPEWAKRTYDKRDVLTGLQQAWIAMPACGLLGVIGDAIQEIQSLRGQIVDLKSLSGSKSLTEIA